MLQQRKRKVKCNTLIETNIQGQPKHRNKLIEYTDIESFRNKTTLQEIEIKENQREKEIHFPQGGRKNNQGENNKQKGGREERKMQRKGKRKTKKTKRR